MPRLNLERGPLSLATMRVHVERALADKAAVRRLCRRPGCVPVQEVDRWWRIIASDVEWCLGHGLISEKFYVVWSENPPMTTVGVIGKLELLQTYLDEKETHQT